jgi:hypothetical protein
MALTVLALTVAVIESSFRALLMPAIRWAPLPQARSLPADQTAIPLPPITVGAQEEQRAAFTGKTKPWPQNHFLVRRHTSPPAALDNDQGFVAG